MTPWLNVIRIDNVEYDVTEFIPNHPETFLKLKSLLDEKGIEYTLIEVNKEIKKNF